MEIVEQYLLQLNTLKRRFRRFGAFLAALSLLVVLTVFWNLRQTGVAIANDACCGIAEHQHADACISEKTLICGFDAEIPTEIPAAEPTETPTAEPAEEPVEEPAETPTEAPVEEPTETPTEAPVGTVQEEEVVPSESIPAEDLTQQPAEHVHSDACYQITYGCELAEHVHDFSCYPDLTADLEDWGVWNAATPELTGRISEDIVIVAQTQLGCQESTLNFQLEDDGVTRNGITRFGQWYGNPYAPWSNMFTAFCLRFAGLDDVPIHSGAEKMQLDWQELNLYRHAGGYEPATGDIVFLDKNQNGTPEATGVVVRYFDFILTVIEGDVDNAVVQTEYRIDDPVITGYGITNAANRLMMLAPKADTSSVTIGQTTDYANSEGTFILYATVGGASYAIDGNGDAVPIQISDGNILADIEDPTTLYWEFAGSRSTYTIKNASTGKYLSPRKDGLLNTTSQNLTLTTSGTGATIRAGSRNNYFYVQYSDSEFKAATSDSTIYFGKTPTQYSLWLDGTNGNLMSYRGSDDTKYTVFEGAQMQLPSTWKSPAKYHYQLAGWVNVKTGKYYAPGDTITVTENTVLYADWVANTYDIGEFNPLVADTVSTNNFITTHIFDYSSLINLLSSKATVNVSTSDHSESWSHVSSGEVVYTGKETLNFSFNDHDSSGSITNLNNLNAPNKYTGGTGVYSNIYTDALGEALFSTDNLLNPETGEGIMGKHYLGQGDYLFQINDDPTSDYYGYYYYDADLNAAIYNQSAQRFYVYDYLVKASDSGSNDYSDFLPLNSVYANNNGQTVKTYTHNGITNYSFESRYENNVNSMANLWFGMRVDVQFGLPEAPGELGEDGVNGNKDIYGHDMNFHFTGDDDVWILVDGKVALDLGGIHQAADGDINFTTGEIRVNGSSAGTLQGIGAGEHTLSILYLERGASMSNCAIYFNLAPRFALELQKEDALSQELLDGATFEFFHNQACTVPCELWSSRQAYKDGEEATNVFTVENGHAYIWGLNPSSTYYIREKTPPNNDPDAPSGAPAYERANGIIKLTLDKNGLNSHSATILEELDKDGNTVPVSEGFTVHSFHIDEENQTAYISITNAKNWVTETTSVYVQKTWNDNLDHSADAVTVYLNVTDPNGTVRKIREIQLSAANKWKYEWTNLPKYALNTDGTSESNVALTYSVSEAYVPGYMGQVSPLENGTYTEEQWKKSETFVEDVSLLLNTNKGYLSAVGANQKTLRFVDEATAKTSPLALWEATVDGKQVKLTNPETGRSLTYYKYGNTRYFYLNTDGQNNQTLTTSDVTGGFRLQYKDGTKTYYVGNLNNSSYLEAASSTGALTIQPMVKTTTTHTINLEGYGFTINNIPLDTETALTVKKAWDHPNDDATLYEQAQVTFKLFRNGEDTGGTQTVSLKNNWTAVFEGLPYLDEKGEPYVYTVVEDWETNDWIPIYGEVKRIDGDIPTYEITVTNRYRWIDAFELPSTGGTGYPLLVLCGLLLIAAPFVYGFSLRCKHGRRLRK